MRELTKSLGCKSEVTMLGATLPAVGSALTSVVSAEALGDGECHPAPSVVRTPAPICSSLSRGAPSISFAVIKYCDKKPFRGERGLFRPPVPVPVHHCESQGRNLEQIDTSYP